MIKEYNERGNVVCFKHDNGAVFQYNHWIYLPDETSVCYHVNGTDSSIWGFSKYDKSNNLRFYIDHNGTPSFYDENGVELPPWDTK